MGLEFTIEFVIGLANLRLDYADQKIAFLSIQTVFLFEQCTPIAQLLYPKNVVVLTPQHRIPRPTKGTSLFVNDDLMRKFHHPACDWVFEIGGRHLTQSHGFVDPLKL
jgi:antirestriction protein ArdC